MIDHNLVTKEDLLQLEASLRQDMVKMEAKIESVKNDLILKLGSLMVVGFGTLAVLMKIL